jgi:hypothetical protein
MRDVLLIVNPSMVAAAADASSDALEPDIVESQALLRAALYHRNAQPGREDARRDTRRLAGDLRGLNARHAGALACERISSALERHWSGGLIVVEEADEWPEGSTGLLADIDAARLHAGRAKALAMRQCALDRARAVDFLALHLQEPDVRVSVAGEPARVQDALAALERLGVTACAFDQPDLRQGEGSGVPRERSA